ncbi:hypothetical protein [Pseudomonas sp. BIC9C]|nr:hypothetical protein [Pseudomonas sp. BIC9C]
MKILVSGVAGFQLCIEQDEGPGRFVAWFRTDYCLPVAHAAHG